MNIYFVCSPDRKVFAWGQTTRSYKERHKDTDWNKLRTYLTARGEDLVLIAWYENVDIVDHDIHTFLKKTPGIPFPKRGEWSSYNEKMHSIDSIKGIVEEEFFISEKKERVIFEPYPYQREFVAKAQGEWLEFLLFAKCRSGKSAMTLNHIVNSNRKVSLLVSYRRSPSDSWFQDATRFDIFKNIRVIDMKDPSWKSDLNYYLQNPELQIVLWSTVQGLQRGRLKQLKELTNINLLILDESHIGNSAKQFQNIRNQLITTPCLSISGTAYNQIWQYPEENTFVYSYFEEQLDNKLGVYKNPRPKMNVKVVKYQSNLYQSIYGDDPDAMKNIFHIEDSEFVNKDLVRDFIQKYFAPQIHIRNRKDRLFGSSQHMLMCLPSVEACHLFARMVESYYLPFVVTGETGRGSDDIEKFIQENIEGKTITLTYEANVLGVTQELWDTIINAKEGKSAEFWTQFAFRGGSSNKDWDVVDFCPQRSLESLIQYYVTSSERNPALLDYNLVDFVPIYEFENGFRELSQEEISGIVASDANASVRIISSVLSSLDYNKLKDFQMNIELKSSSKDSLKSVTVNDNDTNGKSNKVKLSSKNKGDKELLLKIKTLKSITDSIPLIQFYELKEGKRIQNTTSLLTSDLYAKITQDTDNCLARAFDEGLLNLKSFTHRLVQSSTQVESSMNQDEMGTLFKLSISKGSNRTIPLELLDNMYSRG
tara:strand:- start:2240 stop:4363 length:2124 start_codon:yes stop_codon:yes gene_type:complete